MNHTGIRPGRLILSAGVLVLIAASALSSTPAAGRARQERGGYDLLITGGTVVDGTGGTGRKADVLIRGDRIALVGEVAPGSLEAGRVIDATGLYVTPGFIDAHTHGDPFTTPAFENFLAMGVTTITLGQDGSHPGGRDLAGWLERAAQLELGVNIVMFVGHGTVRRLAGVEMGTDPSPEQMDAMVRRVEEAMAAGCFGLSTGLEYRPGWFAGTEELAAIARPVGRGLLRDGYAADILVFDPAAVRDRATFPEPHRLAEGFSYVIVNGRVVREKGELTGELSGRVLRHPPPG